jgi:hypothetical protein
MTELWDSIHYTHIIVALAGISFITVSILAVKTLVDTRIKAMNGDALHILTASEIAEKWNDRLDKALREATGQVRELNHTVLKQGVEIRAHLDTIKAQNEIIAEQQVKIVDLVKRLGAKE